MELSDLQTMPRAAELAALPDRLRLPFVFDAAALQADLAGLAGLAGLDWTMHFVPQHFTGEWDVLPLRAPRGAVHPILQIAPNAGVRDWDDTPLLARMPSVRAVLALFACPIGAVRLMRLAPGSEIRRHRDDDLSPEFGAARVHVPIVTSAGVDFRLNDAPVSMAPGECWYLRLADPHSVINRGLAARVHLVIDLEVDPWLADLLLAAAAATD